MARELTESAKKILASKGAKLRTHEVHVRRTKNKGYIARHDLRDAHGNPPSDGQRSEAEYALPDKEAMLAHMAEHMDTEPDPNDPGEAAEGE